MSLSSLVVSIIGDLNDDEAGHENTTWPENQIREWVEEGVSLVFDKRPDLFIQRVVIEVANCSLIQETCDCDTIRRVIGQVNEKGRLLKTLRQRGLEVSFEWTGKACRRKGTIGRGTFRLESYAIDTVSDTLYVWPEAPPGERVWIEVECSHRPTADEMDDDSIPLPSGVDVAAKQWALWRAKSMDMEISASAMAAAQQHYRAFFEALGLSADTSTVIHKRESN